MKQHFANKAVLIIGASGGLGENYTRAFLEEGARLLLVSRNKEKLSALAGQLQGDVSVAEADIISEESLMKLAELAGAWSDKIDILINATGFDVRKALEAHSYEEIRKSLDINLLGAILITKIFLPRMSDLKGNTIVHTGGFADGRLAFPYYSTDVAARAGIFSFVESMNRELCQEGKQVRLTYFCPNAANTEAERPYHGVWKEMGVKISSVEEVSKELLKAIRRSQNTAIMGRATRIFAKLNALSPKLADTLLMKKYGGILGKNFGHSENGRLVNGQKKRLRMFGIVLVALSFLLYALLPVLPFLPLSMQAKVFVAGGMMGISEVVFWVGGILLGKELIKKIRQKFNALQWLCCGCNRVTK